MDTMLQDENQKEKDPHILNEQEHKPVHLQDQINCLEVKVSEQEKLLKEQGEQLLKLNSQLSAFNQEVRMVNQLKAQMDVFETNLTVEKEASIKKIENLTQELNELRAIVSLNSACGSDIDYAYEAVTAKEEPKIDCTKSDIMLCPICLLGFSDMHSLELHVNNCLDKAID